MRIVSLVPSSTETLLDLGADVIACSKFCEQPQLPHVGGTKNPDIAAIVELAPDLVVLDREENRIEDHDALVSAGMSVFVSEVRSLESAVRVVTDLAVAAGLTAPPPDAMPPTTTTETRRTAFVPIWRRPWMTIGPGTYGASLLAHVGVDLVELDHESDYPIVELEEIAECRPSLVLVPSEPYEFTENHLDELRRALPDAQVRRVDGQDLFWWGSRTRGAVERLAEALSHLPTDGRALP